MFLKSSLPRPAKKYSWKYCKLLDTLPPTLKLKGAKLIGAKLFSIPSQSPELNPIENVFSFVKKELRLQAIEHQLQRKSYEQFSLRAKATLYSTSTELVNNIIESYGEGLSQIILKKGGRINY